MVTGGLIALYLAVQPYTGWNVLPRWIFWSGLALACGVASFRVWNDAYTERERLRALREQDGLANEAPSVALWVTWSETTSLGRILYLNVRNEGHYPLTDFGLKPLTVGMHTLEFDKVSELRSDIDHVIRYRIRGSMPNSDADLLDVLMLNRISRIDPIVYPLRAEVTKQNGQRRTLAFGLSYAPLHNVRRIPNAVEHDRCITIEAA